MASSDLIGLAFKYFQEFVKLRQGDDEGDQHKFKHNVTRIWHQPKLNARNEVHHCLGAFETYKSYLLNLLEHLRIRSTFLQESCQIHQESYTLYLTHQQQHTDNRLSDLLQEILGEYSKLLLKAREIEDQISRDYYNKVLICAWKYKFAMSALCLFRSVPQQQRKVQQSHQSSFITSLINFEKEKSQIKSLLDNCSELRKEFANHYPIIGMKCSTSRLPSDLTFMKANTVEELLSIFQKIHELPQPERFQQNDSFLSVPIYLLPSPSVAVSPLLWNAQFRYYYNIHYSVDQEERSLPLEQFALCCHQQNTTKFFNHHIYYCLEESLKLRREQKMANFDKVSLVLEEIYACKDVETLDREALQREPFIFDKFESVHRNAAFSLNINPALKQFVCLYPDVVRARSAFTNRILHFAPITSAYYQQYCKNKESATKEIHKLSLFFFTYCPEIIPRKTSSFSSPHNNNFSSTLTNHLMPSQEDVSYKFQESLRISPVPILLKVQEAFSADLQPNAETGYLTSLCVLGLDHPRCNGVAEKLHAQKANLNHVYFYLQDKSSDYFYFIQAIPRKLALSTQHSMQEGSIDIHPEQRLYIESILKEISFEWLSTILPSFQNPSTLLKEPLVEQNRLLRLQRCVWRSCLCNNIGSNNSTNHLCQFHQLLREFVDSCMIQRGNQRNSTKFMPKVTPKEASLGIQSEVNVGRNPSQAGALAMKKDLKILRSSSSLLLEIWDGKLKNTIQTFIRKTVNELNLRAFIELITQSAAFSTNHFLPIPNGRETSQRYSHSSPPWIVWKDKERLQRYKIDCFAFPDLIFSNLRTLQALQNNIEVLSSILTSERFVTRELRYFFDLGCFPNQEIIIIKKEMKQFKDYQQKLLQDSEISSAISVAEELQQHEKQGVKSLSNNLDPLQMIQSNHEILYQILIEENKLLDRKLQLFSQRRQVEAELKQAYLKKMMKMKAMEEAESKDPNSFKNQFSR